MAREKNPQATPPARRAPRKRKTPDESETAARPHFVDPQQRAGLIARAAYFRAMNRGFVPGYELTDWLAAEAEVDAELLKGTQESTSA